MVKNGYAIAYLRYSKKYIKMSKSMQKDNKLGVWQGTFMKPEKMRRIIIKFLYKLASDSFFKTKFFFINYFYFIFCLFICSKKYKK